jgi:hypothetical protein
VTRRPGGSDGPEDVDAAFAEIVADLEREGLGAAVVDEDERERFGPGAEADPKPAPAPQQKDQTDPINRADTDPIGWRVPDVTWEDAVAAEEDAHYVPPEPPPLPRLRAGTVFGILLLAVGILLLAGPQLIGLEPRVATPLSLVSMAAGIGWLILRMRQGPPPDSGWDDGAQL